jgi:hypothetical protein
MMAINQDAPIFFVVYLRMFRQIRVQYFAVDHGASLTSFQLIIGYVTYSVDKRREITTELIIVQEPHTVTVQLLRTAATVDSVGC